MEQLLHVSQDQEVAFFYSLIRKDPDFLQAIDQKQFADTPLHIAAAEGRTQLALEIQRLMPSLGMKLNPDGFSPVDLALIRGHFETVSAIINLNPELVAVQGREGMTPLHYAAETDGVEMLAEFLLRCPYSINKLTVRKESAAHVAVKNGKLAAFRVLLGWLKRTDRRQVLSWRDWKGNTVLHLAASTNQPKVMELLVKEVWVNDKNYEGLTALDIVMELPTQVNGRALQVLHRNGAKRGSSICGLQIPTLEDYLSSKTSTIDKVINFGARLDMRMPGDMRNAVLVVAVLIATITYQAVLSPPGGFRDQNPVILTNSTNITSNIGLDVLKTLGADHGSGKVLMPEYYYAVFMSMNSLGFSVSVGMIALLLPPRRFSTVFCPPLVYLMASYMVALKVTSPSDAGIAIGLLACCVCLLALTVMAVKILVIRRQRFLSTLLFRRKYSFSNSDGWR